MFQSRWLLIIITVLVFLPSGSAFAQPENIPSSESVDLTEQRISNLEAQLEASAGVADNGWILVCSALVLMMTGPGLALFYGGLVRKKNILSTMMQSFILMGIVTVVWAVVGFSLAFAPGNAFIGGLDHIFMNGVGATPDPDYASTFPLQTFMIFQLMFAIITPALITGAFAERMKFSAMVAFMILWVLIVYCPLAHMVWGKGGFLNAFTGNGIPALDFAGGTVVHISSGVSALICAIVLKKRLGYPKEQMAPHSVVLSAVGACLLWVGWFGFNAGSALSSGSLATSAFVTTHFSAAAATLGWVIVEWFRTGKPSMLGAISGSVAGLVAVTPAAGFVTPMSALVIGFISGIFCYFMVTKVKGWFGYDDSLDAFGIHGVGGTLGALLTGIFATSAINDVFGDMKPVGIVDGNVTQFLNQGVGVLITLFIAAVGTYIILKIVNATIGLRVSENDEITGLDLSQHGEEGYNM